MDWVWEIYREYIEKIGEAPRGSALDEEKQFSQFLEILRHSTVTVLVQEPWQNTVRFKGLARYPVPAATALLNDPPVFLAARFGGGKFKLNFHHGWHFVGTRNFHVPGEPRWQNLPEIEL
ncbi:MAG: hypothetical protein D6715_00145 [Calditrichaeota bacterium]|nr:MAG: hypothetical protein D6715_00145 [Calditrichota bacterium]